MKISKRQLKRIINEERSRLVREAEYSGEYASVVEGLEQKVGEMVLDLIYQEIDASGLDLGDAEIARKVAAGLDYAKGYLRY